MCIRDSIDSICLQLVKHLILSFLGNLTVELGSLFAGLHQDILLLGGQLIPCLIRDDNLDCAQSMTVEDQVGGNLLECVGLVVCDGLLSAVHNAGLQCGVQLVEGYNRGAGS